jgi:hypothetical protein
MFRPRDLIPDWLLGIILIVLGACLFAAWGKGTLCPQKLHEKMVIVIVGAGFGAICIRDSWRRRFPKDE